MDVLYIVIPAFNDEMNIKDVISDWYPILQFGSLDSRLVIIDDGSKDNTTKKWCALKNKKTFLNLSL